MTTSPLLLCVDGGSTTLLVAACRGAQVLAERRGDSHVAHGAAVLPMIDEVLRTAGFALADCDALVVALGPGSFTGLRTAVSTMKGLALGLGKPLVGVPTLHALARSAGQGPGARVATTSDARKQQVYAAGWTLGERPELDEETLPAAVLSPEAWADALGEDRAWVGSGDAWTTYPTLGTRVSSWAWKNGYPEASALAACALGRLTAPPALATLEPLYVRRSYVELGLGARAPGREGA